MGKSLTTGRIIVAQRIGAVWLLIHMDRNNPRNITARMNNCGELPNFFCRIDAMRSSSWQRAKAVEMVYPPNSSNVVWLKILPMQKFAAASTSMGKPGFLGSFKTPKKNTRGGI